MAKLTIRETLERGARAMGATRELSKSSRYHVYRVKAGTVIRFCTPSGMPYTTKQDLYLFFGSAGACRISSRNAATSSRDSEAWRKTLIAEARARG